METTLVNYTNKEGILIYNPYLQLIQALLIVDNLHNQMHTSSQISQYSLHKQMHIYWSIRLGNLSGFSTIIHTLIKHNHLEVGKLKLG